MRRSIKVPVKLFILLWKKNGRSQTAWLTFEGGGGRCSDIQLGHKNQGNDRDILPENNKGGGRGCFLSLTAAVKHTQICGLQQWPRGKGGWLKQKWQEDHYFPDTRVFLLERKETEKWKGKRDRGQPMEREAGQMQRKRRLSEMA